MENIEKIKACCENAIKDSKDFMFERAKPYADNEELTEQDKEDILELEATGIVLNFDSADSDNHNFDLGRMRMAKEILELIEKIS